jgi:beta-N-acetylhexosaminidase
MRPSTIQRSRPARPFGRALGLLSTLALLISCGGADPAPPPQAAPGPTTTAASTTTESRTAPAPTGEPSCPPGSWDTRQLATTTVFASLSDASATGLDELLDAGVGGVFVSTAAVPLLADGTLASRVEAVESPPLVAIDEEGGRVQRLRSVLGPLPSAREMARTMSPLEIRATAASHGQLMRDLGITMDFAPVVDVSDEPDDGPIGDRSFGSDPEAAAEAAGSFAAGLVDTGILPTLKHFPGHGRASGDSHDGLVTTPPVEDMAGDIAAFELVAEATPVAIMTGHLAVPGLTDGEPATVSGAAITGLLRDELGFDGLVVTDDLGNMRAVLDRYTVPEASVLALVAGVDMALVPASAVPEVVEAMEAAVDDGRLDEERLREAVRRVLTARDACP